MIREAIEAELDWQGVSQCELARRAGLTQQTVNRYLRGHVDVAAETAGKMLQALGLRIESEE